jgi:serine phosphatase RsbU (regulator of sigma subunit)
MGIEIIFKDFTIMIKIFALMKGLVEVSSTPAKLLRRIQLIVLLVFVVTLFFLLVWKQNSLLSPNVAIERLAKEGNYVPVANWKFKFQYCVPRDQSYVVRCQPIGEYFQGKFPIGNVFPEKIKELQISGLLETSKTGEILYPNTLLASGTLTEAAKRFVASQTDVSFVMARSVQNSVLAVLGDTQFETIGFPSDVVFNFNSRQLLQAETIQLTFDFSGLPSVGPMDLVPALVNLDAAYELTSLPHKQLTSGNLSRQLELGLPVAVAAMAAVLDHSKSFADFAVYLATRSVRAFVPFLQESGYILVSEKQTLYLWAFCVFLNGAAVALFFQFILRLVTGYSLSKYVFIFCAMFSGTVFLTVHLNVTGFFARSDIWSDFLSCLFVVPIVLWKCAHFLKNSNTEEKTILSTSRALEWFRVGLVFVCVAIHGWSEAGELFSGIKGAFSNSLLEMNAVSTFKDILDWKKQILIPGLLAATLLEVGSVSKKMLRVGKEMSAKALLEKELLVGKEVQLRMLPVRRHNEYPWYWRSFYYSAQALAGDWFDVRQVCFPNGKKILAICVADVTGHGVGSSLATSVLCSHWSLWCQDLEKFQHELTTEALQNLLIEAANRLNVGLHALPKNEQSTAILAFVDGDNLQVTLCSCGHPGLILTDGANLRYVATVGDRLGADGYETAGWTAKTEKILPEDFLFFYSDGIVPPGETVSSWAAGMRRKFKKSPVPVVKYFLNLIRENRKEFRANRSIEDDITLLVVKPISETF